MSLPKEKQVRGILTKLKCKNAAFLDVDVIKIIHG